MLCPKEFFLHASEDLVDETAEMEKFVGRQASKCWERHSAENRCFENENLSESKRAIFVLAAISMSESRTQKRQRIEKKPQKEGHYDVELNSSFVRSTICIWNSSRIRSVQEKIQMRSTRLREDEKREIKVL